MFVLSFKHSRKRLILALAVLLVAVTVVVALAAVHGAEPTAVSGGKKYSLSAEDNEKRAAFFGQFGWQAKSEPVGTGEVAIPEKFDDVYTKYNNIQKEQGLDLQPYAGKTCQKWVYEITNYPGQKTMRGTLLVYGGRVVGGDLSTPALDGFMTGFDGQKASKDYSANEPTLARDAKGSLAPQTSSAPASSAPASSAPKKEKPASSAVPANAWPTD